jgi:sirohydrochlorin cobaltochelatase
VRRHARRIRACGLFDDVHVAFWKEPPFVHDALARIAGEDVFIVPVFLADGWFVRDVLPRALGVDAARAAGLRVRYCVPAGAHPAMARLVVSRAVEPGLDAPERARATLVLIGHGTERNAQSGRIVRQLAARLRRRSGFGAVDCGFLDEEPRIAGVVERAASPHVVLVPFLVSDGWHTRETIPQALGLRGTRTERGGRVLWYTRPVGTLPAVARVIVDIARRAAALTPAASA